MHFFKLISLILTIRKISCRYPGSSIFDEDKDQKGYMNPLVGYGGSINPFEYFNTESSHENNDLCNIIEVDEDKKYADDCWNMNLLDKLGISDPKDDVVVLNEDIEDSLSCTLFFDKNKDKYEDLSEYHEAYDDEYWRNETNKNVKETPQEVQEIKNQNIIPETEKYNWSRVPLSSFIENSGNDGSLNEMYGINNSNFTYLNEYRTYFSDKYDSGRVEKNRKSSIDLVSLLFHDEPQEEILNASDQYKFIKMNENRNIRGNHPKYEPFQAKVPINYKDDFYIPYVPKDKSIINIIESSYDMSNPKIGSYEMFYDQKNQRIEEPEKIFNENLNQNPHVSEVAIERSKAENLNGKFMKDALNNNTINKKGKYDEEKIKKENLEGKKVYSKIGKNKNKKDKKINNSKVKRHVENGCSGIISSIIIVWATILLLI
ncbi:hypothetical protein DMUE_3618 [Dictyocoela muelleri]|nr:hypothetical protein DMUE_3618 [Dictyocoela muelleri]